MKLEDIIDEGKTNKLVWTVGTAPTGRFKGFEKRMWPSADFNGQPMINLRCEDPYRPEDVRRGSHKPIKIMVADRRPESNPDGNGWQWRKIKAEAATLPEAKTMAQKFFDNNPAFFGLDLDTK
jgi:hypothetical protein